MSTAWAIPGLGHRLEVNTMTDQKYEVVHTSVWMDLYSGEETEMFLDKLGTKKFDSLSEALNFADSVRETPEYKAYAAQHLRQAQQVIRTPQGTDLKRYFGSKTWWE